jgi:hypothetical protein
LTITIIIDKIANFFRGIRCVTINNLTLDAKTPTITTLSLAREPSLIYYIIAIVVFTITHFVVARSARAMYQPSLIA